MTEPMTTPKRGCELGLSCMWESGTGLHADGTPCIYGQRVLCEDVAANDEDKRWEWSRDAFSWSARECAEDVMSIELDVRHERTADAADRGGDQWLTTTRCS